MSFIKRQKVPEHIQELVNNRLIIIVIDRLRILAPFMLAYLVFCVVTDLRPGLWEADTSNLFWVDLFFLIIMAFICLAIFFKKRGSGEHVWVVHKLIVIFLPLVSFLWSSAVTKMNFDSAGGYLTFIISLMLIAGVIPVKRRFFIIYSLIGFMLLNFVGFSIGAGDRTILLSAIIFALIINHLNLVSISKAVILEYELEAKVVERTAQLEIETENAKRSEALKGRFLANMSHEIRTPLNGILGFSKLLREENLAPEVRTKYLDIILECGNNLLEILNDVMEVSRLETGSCEFFMEEFDLVQLLNEVRDSFSGDVKILSGIVELDFINKTRNELYIESDRIKILQMLNNLVSNAIKYTDSGTVTVGVEKTDNGKVEVYVKDTGRGIAKVDQERIFKRFQQADMNIYNHRDGAGLGLTIVKGYAELTGIEISVESEPGKGTEFRLMIPVKLGG